MSLEIQTARIASYQELPGHGLLINWADGDQTLLLFAVEPAPAKEPAPAIFKDQGRAAAPDEHEVLSALFGLWPCDPLSTVDTSTLLAALRDTQPIARIAKLAGRSTTHGRTLGNFLKTLRGNKVLHNGVEYRLKRRVNPRSFDQEWSWEVAT
jgi:hypothetical protein